MNKPTLHRWMPMLVLPFLLAGAEARSPQQSMPVRGDYLEARTASVFAGACHYNGERVTEGKSAILAWRIESGSFNGIDLAGVKLVAAVVADDNLAERASARKSAVVIDADTDARADAAVAWVKHRSARELGDVVTVRRSPVIFTGGTDAFSVQVADFASVKVKAMPNAACCSQPELVWYAPLSQISDRRVGYTEAAELEANAGLGTSWSRSDENSANYGKIAD